MKEYDVNKLLKEDLDKKLESLLEKKVIRKQEIDKEEIKGHLLKADHNLRFVKETIKIKYIDWALTASYYACYHAVLALIMTKGFVSKNHMATLTVLIKYFYQNGLDKEDFVTLSEFLDYKDLMFYVSSKNTREEASYSTALKFNAKEAEKIRIKATLFISKIKNLID